MIISNPSLTLNFLGGDIPSGGSTSQVINNQHIINHSISFVYQLLNGLKSASNQASLQISKDCPSTEDIIGTDGDIEAVLKDGDTILFTGFVSTSFTWTVAQSGEKALNITLEDRSTRLFPKPFITSGSHLFNCTADSAIRSVCAAAGLTVSSSAISISSQVIKLVESSTTCRDILTQMLYELGYAYYCDNLGELRFFEINCTSVSGLPILDKTKLYVKGGTAISLSKQIRQYRAVRLSFVIYDYKNNFLVYRNTTGQSESYPYCNLELEAGEHFDGLEVYTAQQWAEETADQFREDALVEACNAASDTTVGSSKIISVSDVQYIANRGSDITAEITAEGGPYLKITAQNTGASTQAITRLDAYGTILYEKSTEVLRTGSEGNLTNALYSEELSYIHSRALATRHANLVNQYQKYSNSKYTFYTTEDYALGSLINLQENEHTGLDVNVLITGKGMVSGSNLIKYTAVGISVFDLNKDLYHQSTNTPGTNIKGSSAEIQYALGDSLTEPPVEEMCWNDEPMYWEDDQMFWRIADFTAEVPELVDGFYIWMRVRVADGEWQYSRLTGEQGAAAEVFDFYFSSGVFVQNRRLGTSQTILITTDIQSLSVTPTWSCYIDGVLNNSLFDNASNPTCLVIPYKNSYSTIRVVMSATGQTSVEHSLSFVDETEFPGGKYLGELTALPATPWTEYISGDYFIVKTAFTDDEDSYLVGVPYTYDGTSWHNQLDLSLATSMSKAVDCLGGVLKSDIAVPSTAAIWAWFKNLVAMNAVVQNFFARNATVGDGTGLANSGFRFRAQAYDSTGAKLTSPIFDVMYGANTVFKVSPSSGNVFLGQPDLVNNLDANGEPTQPSTGFMYRASDGYIVSKNGNVQIDDDGKILGNFTKVLSYLPFGFEDSLDASFAMECDIYIPGATDTIKSIKLSARGLAYRAYSKATDSAGSTETESNEEIWSAISKVNAEVTLEKTRLWGSSTDSVSLSIPSGVESNGAHEHSLSGPSWGSYSTGGAYAGGDYHAHSLSTEMVKTKADSNGAHSHGLSTSNQSHAHYLPAGLVTGVSVAVDKNGFVHTHKVDISHSHNLSFGIYESTTPADVVLYVDNGSGYVQVASLGSGSTLASDLDITQYISGTGWKKIKFTSSRLGRIRAQVIAELLINTTQSS